MSKKIIIISLIVSALASSASFANCTKSPLPNASQAKCTPPLTQRPLTLPFNKISDDIIRNYEARRKIIAHNEATQNERERLQASRDHFKKERTYLLSGKV